MRYFELFIVVSLTMFQACKEEAPAPQDNKQPAQEPYQPQPQPYQPPSTFGTQDAVPTSTDQFGDCTASNCPKGDVRLLVDGSERTYVEMQMGQQSTFTITSEARDYTSHRLAINVRNSQELSTTTSSQISGNQTDRVEIRWTPEQRDPSVGIIRMYVRDKDACELRAQDRSKCSDYSLISNEFDTEYELRWSISTNGVITGNNNNGDNNDDLWIQIGLGALGSLFNGGYPFTGALNGAQSGVNSGFGGFGGLLNGQQSPIGTTLSQ